MSVKALVGAVFATTLSLAAGVAGAADPAERPAATGGPTDPFAWLEDIHGARALAWVADENRRTAARLETDPRFEPFRKAALAIFTAKDRIPTPEIRAGGVDNLWQDADHPHGLWRRARFADYVRGEPVWETLLDLDALSRAEGRNWFWKGATCLRPEDRFCLVRLSDGGGDAVSVREFDSVKRRFVEGGFTLDAAKQVETWLDKDTLLAARPWTPETTTTSGYAYVLKILRRGAPLGDARTVYEGARTDQGPVSARVLRGAEGGVEGVILERSVSFFDKRYLLYRGEAQTPLRLDLPPKSELGPYVRHRLTLTLQQDWKAFKAGDLIALDGKALASGGAPVLVFRPTADETIDAIAATRGHLLVAVLKTVQGGVLDLAEANGRWTGRRLPTPAFSAVTLGSTSQDSEAAFIATEGFLTPTTLWLADAQAAALKPVTALPARFDGSKDVVEQFQAVSNDGTKVPYFVVRPKIMPFDGSTPTQMFGYGGFLISYPPAYKPELGKLWLERGGAYVVANIRGGGEFGPAWHDAALRENRQRAFDDFAAVAKDLFARGITSPRRLGIYGRSNGGVLTSVSMIQHPDYWNALVIESPLIDMLRFNHLSAGASWMAEYGDPDVPADRAFIEKYSAYQGLRPGVAYPEPYITTNTEDDRVHPGHARKFAAKLQALGDAALYYENTFGGHANDADPELNARRWARHYVYLSQKLMDAAPGASGGGLR